MFVNASTHAGPKKAASSSRDGRISLKDIEAIKDLVERVGAASAFFGIIRAATTAVVAIASVAP